jgi:hypothetical protein
MNDTMKQVILWLVKGKITRPLENNRVSLVSTVILFEESRWKVEYMAGWDSPVRLSTYSRENWNLIESINVDITGLTVADVADAICSLAEECDLNPAIFKTGQGNYRIWTEHRFRAADLNRIEDEIDASIKEVLAK